MGVRGQGSGVRGRPAAFPRRDSGFGGWGSGIGVAGSRRVGEWTCPGIPARPGQLLVRGGARGGAVAPHCAA